MTHRHCAECTHQLTQVATSCPECGAVFAQSELITELANLKRDMSALRDRMRDVGNRMHALYGRGANHHDMYQALFHEVETWHRGLVAVLTEHDS